MDKRLTPEPGVQECGNDISKVAYPLAARQKGEMRKLLIWVGVAGSWTANVLTWFGVPGAVAMSAVLAFATVWFDKLGKFVSTQTVRSAAEMFVFSLWTIIGLMTIARMGRPVLVKRATQLDYGICIESVGANYVPFSEMALQFNVGIRNYSGEPLKYKLLEFSVDISTRHIDSADDSVEGIVGNGGGAVIAARPFPRSDVEYFAGQRIEGKAKFQLIYGPVKGDFCRKITIKLTPIFDFAKVKETPPMMGFSAPVKSYDEENV